MDPADYKRLNKYEWRSKKSGRCFHAIRQMRIGKSAKFTVIYMHRDVIKVPEGMVVDHINHDGMDNRRVNLRAATHAQNAYHTKKRSGATHSKYKGIHWRKKHKKWVARIMFEGKRIYLGCFRNEIEAAKAYDRAARKYHGEFASLNFPKTV